MEEETKTNVDVNKLEDLVGQKVFFRTVTYHILGEVESIIGNVIKLKTASWIADSGRFADFIKDGISDVVEVEPLGSWFVNFNAVVDFGIWKHKLPTKQQ